MKMSASSGSSSTQKLNPEVEGITIILKAENYPATRRYTPEDFNLHESIFQCSRDFIQLLFLTTLSILHIAQL
jgi:hypothetical protein